VSLILEELPREHKHGDTPRLRLRCGHCGNVYVTSQRRWNARHQKRCAKCKRIFDPHLGRFIR